MLRNANFLSFFRAAKYAEILAGNKTGEEGGDREGENAIHEGKTTLNARSSCLGKTNRFDLSLPRKCQHFSYPFI